MKSLVYDPSLIIVENDVRQAARPILEKLNGCADIRFVNRAQEIDVPPLGEKCRQALMLVKQRGKFIEKCPGTPKHICCNYYVAVADVGCIYDCTYCFLQSFSNTPCHVLYLNDSDLIAEARAMSAKTVFWRLGTGEYGDSLALDRLTNFCRTVVPALIENDNMILELKTKSAEISNLHGLPHKDRIVIGWSLNAEEISAQHERGAPDNAARIEAARVCQEWGFRLAFHFDPIIHYHEWEKGYHETIEKLTSTIDPKAVEWISLGALRYTANLTDIAETRQPDSSILYGEHFSGTDGKMRYLRPIREQLFCSIKEAIHSSWPAVTIYLCMESQEVWQTVFGETPMNSRKYDLIFAPARTRQEFIS